MTTGRAAISPSTCAASPRRSAPSIAPTNCSGNCGAAEPDGRSGRRDLMPGLDLHDPAALDVVEGLLQGLEVAQGEGPRRLDDRYRDDRAGVDRQPLGAAE